MTGKKISVWTSVAVVALLACGPGRAWAGISGSGGGSLIVNTVYNTVNQQQTQNHEVWQLLTSPPPPIAPGDAQFNSLLQQVAGADGSPNALTDLQGSFYVNDPPNFGGTTLFSLAGFGLSNMVNHGTTNSTQSNVTYTETPGAVVIGDPSDLQSVFNGTTIVVSGTVTVTDTETTTNTLHLSQNLNIFVTPASGPAPQDVHTFTPQDFAQTTAVAPLPAALWMGLTLLGLLGVMKTRRTAA